MVKNKLLKIGVVIGLIFIIFAPMVGGLFETLQVKKDKDRTISEESSVSFREVAAYEITVKRNQKYIIKFSVYSINVSASLKIFGKGFFDSEFQKNATNAPQTVTGKYFLVSQPSWAYDPSSTEDSLTVVTCDQDDFYYIEFMGDGQSVNDLIWNEPGDYVITVYGTNSFANNTNVTFNIEIFKSGPSEVIKKIFSYTGWAIIIITCLVISIKISKKWRDTD
ncbi:MAG: hypothetical protein JW776_13560 [Candidatus Lokiarchaeota archaeon]|nr:hypothetical protein [Candidatus Lokiarchaeota archaeon]